MHLILVMLTGITADMVEFVVHHQLVEYLLVDLIILQPSTVIILLIILPLQLQETTDFGDLSVEDGYR